MADEISAEHSELMEGDVLSCMPIRSNHHGIYKSHISLLHVDLDLNIIHRRHCHLSVQPPSSIKRGPSSIKHQASDATHQASSSKHQRWPFQTTASQKWLWSV